MTTDREPIWMVPRRPDPGFVGREAELAAVAAALASTGRSAMTQPANVHGLGGVGKTLLAVEYACRHQNDYDAVLWLAAENPAALASAFADLAGTLGLPEASERDQPPRTAAVCRWMETNARWLMVFDNAECRQDVEPYLPVRLKGHVLITSRNPDWQPLARPVAVRPLPRPDSVALLRGAEGLGSEPDADLLADALGDLPLALAQAAAYVRATACSFAEYLGRFQAQDAALENEAWAEPGYGRTVAATLELALATLRPPGQDGPGPAEALLARCAFYAPEVIPRELLAADFPDAAALDDAVRTLRHYSLAETASGTLSVHRLVQRAVRSRMPVDQQESFAGHAVEAVDGLFPTAPWDVRTWPKCERLLAHALHAADLAVGLGVATEPTTGLLNQIGIHLTSKHDLPRARKQLATALELIEAANGPDHPMVARILNNLGIVARAQGDLAEARRCQERALRVKEAADDPDHLAVARTVGNLGFVARDQRELAEAWRCQERALQAFEAADDPDHLAVARTLGELGTIAFLQGDLTQARRFMERAMGAFEAADDPDHPEAARILNVLGLVALEQGYLAAARQLVERALRAKEAAYVQDHPEIARTLGNLGFVARAQGDLAEARRCHERALATFRKFLGEEHPNTVTARNNLRLLDQPTPKPVPEPTPILPAVAEPAPIPPTGGPMIKVLFLAANPAGTTPLALDEEIRAVDANIRGSEHRDRMHLVSHWAVRLDDLSGLLMRQRPDVVHFSGHGASTGDICLVGGDGKPRTVPPEALAGLFGVLKDNVRVVVFNACHSEAQAKAVVKVIDCAVGMSRAIGDGHAIAFAAEFYQALGYGKSVRDAYELGVVRLIGEGVPDARKLVKLHKRRGIDPAAVVLVGAGPGATSPQPATPALKPQPTPSAAGQATLPAAGGKAPSAFLSYSWDDDAHREWVKQFATRLAADGVAVTLDRWHAAPGGQIPAFMERAVRDNDFVITVCTPGFKEKSDRRGGGVGYEGDVMTAEVFTGTAREKFIPVLRRGSWRDAAPSWLLGSYYIDLSADPYSEANYEDLLRTLHGARETAPPPGPRPDFGPRPSGPATGTPSNL